MLISIAMLLLSTSAAESHEGAADRGPATVATMSLAELHDASDFDAVARRTSDPVLTRRLLDLRRAVAQQQQAHKQFQAFHPRRDAADDRVLLLNASVTQRSRILVEPVLEVEAPAWAPLPDASSSPPPLEEQAGAATHRTVAPNPATIR